MATLQRKSNSILSKTAFSYYTSAIYIHTHYYMHIQKKLPYKKKFSPKSDLNLKGSNCRPHTHTHTPIIFVPLFCSSAALSHESQENKGRDENKEENRNIQL